MSTMTVPAAQQCTHGGCDREATDPTDSVPVCDNHLEAIRNGKDIEDDENSDSDADHAEFAGEWSDADFANPERDIYPDELLERLAESDGDRTLAVQCIENAGPHGATLYSDSGIPRSGVCDLDEIANDPLSDSNRWVLTICAAESGGPRATETDTSSIDTRTTPDEDSSRQNHFRDGQIGWHMEKRL